MKTINLENRSEGDRITGLYRGVSYSGTIKSFTCDEKQLTWSAYVVLDSPIEGSSIARREAGELLKVTHDWD